MSDDFSTRYRLLKCVLVEDGIRTHNAQELATGKVVMVHISDGAGPDEVEALRGQMAQLQALHKHKILETATLPSGFAVVTEFLPGSLSFRAWLSQFAEVPEAPPSSASLPEITRGGGQMLTADVSVPDTSVPAVPPGAVSQPEIPRMNSPALTSNAPAPGLPASTGMANSFTAIFGAPKDPGATDNGVLYVASGPANPAPISFALDPAGGPPLPPSAPAGAATAGSRPIAELVAPLPTWLQPGPAAQTMPQPTGDLPVLGASTLSSAPAAPAVPAPPPAAPATPPAGEFTMMFAPSPPAASLAVPPGPAITPTAAAVPKVPTPAAAQPASEPVPAWSMVSAPEPASPMATVSEPASPMASGPVPLAAVPLAPFLSGPVPATPVPLASAPLVPFPSAPVPAARVPAAPAPPPPAAPPPSPFGWDSAPSEPAPIAKAPPGEFTMMFGAPSTAAPLPDQMRASPMREAPPPSFSPLTPASQLESPPVEPRHRVMGSNPLYAAGINQEGPSPIANNLSGGGYAGHYLSPQPPSHQTNYPGEQRYSGMPEFAPAPPPPSYPAAHASPLVAAEKSFGAEPSAMPGILPPPIFGNGGATPLSALGGAAPLINASAGPSEYTQLIGRGAAPVIPELKPTANAGTVKSKGRRLPTGLIVVVNAVLLVAALLMFFVLKRQVPTARTIVPKGPVMPSMPTAPQIPR